MRTSLTSRHWVLVSGVALAVVGLAVTLAVASPALATSSYADATGQRCAACHAGQPSQGMFTADGQRFAAIASHRTDPAGAWAAVTGAGAGGAPAQVPSQLPRTGEAEAPRDVAWAIGCGLVLIVLGSTLEVRRRRRLR